MKLLETNKNIPRLDARLQAVADLVRPHSVVADIGCDHGLLCVHLAVHRLCKKVIACDINEKPLGRAKRNLSLHVPQSMFDCRLGDAFSVLSPDEVDDIVIAGVSGVTMCDMLSQAKAFWQKPLRFIFVPAAKPHVLRAWLCEHGFTLLQEVPAQAAGRVYTVMHVQYTGEVTVPSALFASIGLINDQSDSAHAYLQKEYHRVRRLEQSASDAERDAWKRLSAQLEQELAVCLPSNN